MKLDRNEKCPHCGRYANRPLAINVILMRNDKVLLIKRGVELFKGYWALPSGYVNWDETVEDTVKREVKEELNLKVIKMKLLGLYSKPERHPEQCINASYLIEVEGELKAGDDAKEAKWFTINEIPEELGFDHKEILEDYLKMAKN